ncbi:SGNH hydrolase [Thozetella sp. PMI_491]|nr:SGNH hydrolase [Thozetella sp. PMI_491]
MGSRKLRILCFGDSLTNGYSSFGAIYHPYSETLQQMIAMALPELEVEIVENGQSGDMVRGDFLRRMEKQCRFKKQTFDWTIVLGGTNDLAFQNIQPDDVYDELKKVWSVPLLKKSKVLALTVPEAGVGASQRERLGARRNRLNTLIKEHKEKNFHVFDLHDAVPYFAMSEADRERYWDDAVHFTPDGYDLIGQKLGLAFVSLLVRERAEPARRRLRKFRDDDVAFAEETGDPTAIDQGYIVVRRTDLS